MPRGRRKRKAKRGIPAGPKKLSVNPAGKGGKAAKGGKGKG